MKVGHEVRRVRFRVEGSGKFPYSVCKRQKAFFAAREDGRIAQGAEQRKVTLEVYLKPEEIVALRPDCKMWSRAGWPVVATYFPEHVPLSSVPKERRP